MKYVEHCGYPQGCKNLLSVKRRAAGQLGQDNTYAGFLSSLLATVPTERIESQGAITGRGGDCWRLKVA